MQNRYTNKLWAILAILSTIAFFPPSVDSNLFRYLPIDPARISLVLFPVIAIILAAYCGAHAQAVFAKDRADAELDKMRIGSVRAEAQDLFYALMHPSFLRVFPLARVISDRAPRPTAVFYFFLKILIGAIAFILPMLGLFASFLNLLAGDIFSIHLIKVASIPVMAIMVLVLLSVGNELRYAWKTTLTIWRGR